MNNNPVHNRKRLARRIWKRLAAGYFTYVVITFGEGKSFKKIEIAKRKNGYFINIRSSNKTPVVESNVYKLLVDAVRQADDIKCFGNKFVTKEWNALCFMKAYSYQKLVFTDCGGCYIV